MLHSVQAIYNAVVARKVHFLVGRKSVETIRFTGAKLPSKKDVQVGLSSRQLARCVLTTWMRVELGS